MEQTSQPIMEKFNIHSEEIEIHKHFPSSTKAPIIGITANFKDGNAALAEAYYRSVLKAGGVPIIIPPYQERNALIESLKLCDAILLSGGADIDPRYMGEEPDYSLLHTINPKRDEQELLLVLLATNLGLPILGICRGMQTIAIALGGSVHQDIYAASKNELLNHDQEPIERGIATHTVSITPGSKLAKIFNRNELAANTFHHQAVKKIPEGFSLSAVATDGIFEAMEATDGRSIIAVQWHPESFIMNNDHSMMPIFEWLVNEAALYQKSKEIHNNIITLDSHCDTPMLFEQGYKLQERSEIALVDLHKMQEGGLDVATMAVYLPQGHRDEVSLHQATTTADKLLEGIETRVKECQEYITLCKCPTDLQKAKLAEKHAIMPAIENGYAIGKDISNIERYRNKGVVYMTLCHNGDNDICDSARGNGEHGGLSPFGKEVVQEMNRVGMMIDLSHAAESTFWQVLELSTKPVVCSHSSCKALCNHPRNLTDEQIKALAIKGGVIQVTMYSGFLCEDGEATIADFIEHLEHAIKIAGIDHVGIGTDFDGDGKVIGCSSASQLRSITIELLRKGYKEEDIEKIWSGNWLRTMQQVQQVQQLH